MTFQYIIGSLATTKPEAVNLRTRRSIYNAATTSGLYLFIGHDHWEDGLITMDHLSSHKGEAASAEEFISNLVTMLEQPGVTELELEGEIALTIPGEAPEIYKIHVTAGEVTYQQATLDWGNVVNPAVTA